MDRLQRWPINSTLVLALMVAPAQMGLAQDVPGIACIVANADTGLVSDMRDFLDGGTLIGAEKGLFLARAVNGAVTVAPAGLADTGAVSDMRDFNVTPHVAQNTTNRLSAIDGRTIRHCGYEVSQQKRKRVEKPFGWGKTIGGLARPMLRGVKQLDFKFTLTMAAYNLIKLPRLIGATA